jgi:hypothetical protein
VFPASTSNFTTPARIAIGAKRSICSNQLRSGGIILILAFWQLPLDIAAIHSITPNTHLLILS